MVAQKGIGYYIRRPYTTNQSSTAQKSIKMDRRTIVKQKRADKSGKKALFLARLCHRGNYHPHINLFKRHPRPKKFIFGEED